MGTSQRVRDGLPWFPAVRLLTLLFSGDNREKHDA